MKLKELKPGDRFVMVGLEWLGEFRLVRLSFSGATIRSTRKNRVAFESNGEDVEFDAAGKKMLVAAETLVELNL
jgi:hypothetical protein